MASGSQSNNAGELGESQQLPLDGLLGYSLNAQLTELSEQVVIYANFVIAARVKMVPADSLAFWQTLQEQRPGMGR